MPYTVADFERDYIKKYFPRLTPEEQREVLERLSPEDRRQVLQALPPEERLAGLSPEAIVAGLSDEQIRQLLDRLAASRAAQRRKSRRKR